MGIVDRIKSAIGTAERTYEYECENCGEAFETGQSRMVDVSCPECSSTEIVRA